jgi:3'(2'), 5'-bisphosphate nucleotidase
MSGHISATISDGELAAHLAEQAGRILLQVRASGLFSGKVLGKAGDQTANQFLCHALREQRTDDGLLSEEEKDNLARLAKKRVWIIDPVDGTREYGEERTDWAVHVALAINGRPPSARWRCLALASCSGPTSRRSSRRPHPGCAWWSAAPVPPRKPWR